MGLKDFNTAGRMRDLIVSIVEDVIDRKRPASRIGRVVDFNIQDGTADVIFPGSFTPIRVDFTRGLQPGAKAVYDDAARKWVGGDLVRVEGRLGSYYISDIVDGYSPSGHRIPGEFLVGGFIVAPVGWLACNGATYMIDDYQDLYDAIGTTFGGNGTTNFMVPDFRDRFLMGAGPNFPIGFVNFPGATNQEILDQQRHAHIHGAGSLVSSDAGGHQHGIDNAGSHDHGGGTGGPSGTVTRADGGFGVAGPTHNHSIAAGGTHTHGGGSTGTTGSHNHGITGDTSENGVLSTSAHPLIAAKVFIKT